MSIEDTCVESTAILTAHKRQLSGLPFAVDIYTELVKADRDWVVNTVGNTAIDDAYSAELEIRYRVIDKVIDKENIDWVIDIASGFSGRGLAYKQKECSVVEVDLPEVAKLKEIILKRIDPKGRHILVVPGDVLQQTTWKLIEDFPVLGNGVLVNEGFMRYLNFSQKRTYCSYIKKILLRNKSRWITCDITLNEMLSEEEAKPDIKCAGLANRVINANYNNAFEDIHEAVVFFEDEGFSVNTYKPSDFPELLSESQLHLSLEEHKNISRLINVFEMKIP